MSGYPSNPNPQTGAPSTSPWSTFTVWQYADTNWSGGDSDVFNGTTNQMWQTLMIGGNGGPIITNDIDSVTANVGDDVTFSVGSLGTAPFTYRWYSNQVNVATTTTPTFTVTNVQPSSAGNYYVSISNSLGIATSTLAYLSILYPPTNAPNAVVSPTGIVDFWSAEDNADRHLRHQYLHASRQVLVYGRTRRFGLPLRRFDRLPDRQRLGITCAVDALALGQSPKQYQCFDGHCQRRRQFAEARAIQPNASGRPTQFGIGDYSFGYTTPVATWTHLVFVGTSTGTSLYANGVLKTTLTNSIPLPRKYLGVDYVNSTGNLLDYVNASIDEIAVYNRALSATEITTLYNASTIVHAPELTGVTVTATPFR